jgi:hypothetical protein
MDRRKDRDVKANNRILQFCDAPKIMDIDKNNSIVSYYPFGTVVLNLNFSTPCM